MKRTAMEGNRILLPVDGSHHAMRATEYAIDLAGLMKGRILLLHCHRSFPKMIGEPLSPNHYQPDPGRRPGLPAALQRLPSENRGPLR